MRIAIIVFIFLHGLIHLIGFFKAFNLASVKTLSFNISKEMGLLWLLSFALFSLMAVMMFLDNKFWWSFGILGVILSQVLIIFSWHDAKYGTIANVIILLISIIGFFTWKYYSKYQHEVQMNLNQSIEYPIPNLEEKDIIQLPEAVQKYIKYSGCVGKPKVYNFKVEFIGKIRKDENSDWMPFKSEQYNFMSQSTRLFFMKAEMKHLPVAGYHSFNNGKAVMDIRLFSTFKVQYMDGPEMDKAETVTFFNDMCCMAPATLIDNRIKWEVLEKNKVNAIFTNNDITITAQLDFNDEGQLINFISNDRYSADVNTGLPWETPLKNYKNINGYNIAGYAETINHYPNKKLTYGVFETKSVTYNIQKIQ